jgi:hypothetical protein
VSSLVDKNVRLAPWAKSLALLRTSCPARGALRDRHERWVQDAMDAATSEDEWCACIRRSRVVLMPRRWHQVARKCPRDDGGKKARSPGRARRKPLKPLRRECRSFGVPVVTNSCVFHFTHEAAGALSARHSPRPLLRVAPAPSFEGRTAPSSFEGGFRQKLGRIVPRERELTPSPLSPIRWVSFRMAAFE